VTFATQVLRRYKWIGLCSDLAAAPDGGHAYCVERREPTWPTLPLSVRADGLPEGKTFHRTRPVGAAVERCALQE